MNFIRKECQNGRQAYVICPLIEESEKLDLENAQEVFEQLVTELAPVRVGLLHGRMSPAEKDEVMRLFAENDVQVLVSTTVVEVGVNVPNATVMVIYDADRFVWLSCISCAVAWAGAAELPPVFWWPIPNRRQATSKWHYDRNH